MPEFEKLTTEEIGYLYVERESSMDPVEIGQAMGSAFEAVYAFMMRNNITPTGPALSVYDDMSADGMKFRAGFAVAKADIAKAEGDVKGDVTPAGPAVHFTHIGSYDTLREGYGAVMKAVAKQCITLKSPTWELYMNDPGTTPEAELITECYLACD